jgi:hypothetical protein
MAQTSKSFRHLGSGWKPGTRLWKYLKNQLAQDSQFFCGNLCDVRVTEAKMRFHHCLARIKSSIQMNNIHTARGCNTTWSCRSGDEPDQDFGRETSRSLRNVLETTQTNRCILLRRSHPVIVLGGEVPQALHILGRRRPQRLIRMEGFP